MRKPVLALATLAAVLAGAALPAAAQDAREAQLIGFHQLCNHGDRAACVKFGMMRQQNHDRQAEWRRTRPDFFFFER
ncbi:MAG TPA: hypothetical protein VH414_12840 [Lichenihabitans sp.]|jgi:hypothetical protein|nr:hypothetical protein [Lichenihabitans sp.]